MIYDLCVYNVCSFCSVNSILPEEKVKEKHRGP